MLTESCFLTPNLAAELPVLLDKLCMFDLEEHIDEVIYHIYHIDFEHNRYTRGTSDWSVLETVRWMQSLKFLGQESEDICSTLRRECIDGNCLMALTEHDWVYTLHLNPVPYILIRIIMQGWKMGPSDWEFSGSSFDTPIGMSAPHVTPHNSLFMLSLFYVQGCLAA